MRSPAWQHWGRASTPTPWRQAMKHSTGPCARRASTPTQIARYACHLPPSVLARVLEGLVLTLMEARNDGDWADPELAVVAASACLIALGVSPQQADEIARSVGADAQAAAVPTQAHPGR